MNTRSANMVMILALMVVLIKVPAMCEEGDLFFSTPLKVKYVLKIRHYTDEPYEVKEDGTPMVTIPNAYRNGEPLTKEAKAAEDTGQFYSETQLKKELFYQSKDELFILSGRDHSNSKMAVAVYGENNGEVYKIDLLDGRILNKRRIHSVDRKKQFYPHKYFLRSQGTIPDDFTGPQDDGTSFTVTRENGHASFYQSKLPVLTEWKATSQSGRAHALFTDDWTTFRNQKMPGEMREVTYSVEPKMELEMIYEDIQYEPITAEEYESIREEYFLRFLNEEGQ